MDGSGGHRTFGERSKHNEHWDQEDWHHYEERMDMVDWQLEASEEESYHEEVRNREHHNFHYRIRVWRAKMALDYDTFKGQRKVKLT